MVLEINDLGPGRILSIEAEMHSNKSAGSGSMILTVDGLTYHQIVPSSYSSSAWAGRYSSEWDTLCWVREESVRTGSVRMVVRASVNSLYIRALRVRYVPDGDRPYRVCLYEKDAQEDVLVESDIAAGVLLPECPNSVGWVNSPVEKAYVSPRVYRPGTMYYPEENDTLYALYHCSTDTVLPDTMRLPEAGEYAIYEPLEQVWLSGSMGEYAMADTTVYHGWMPSGNRYRLEPEGDHWLLDHVACQLRPASQSSWLVTRCSDEYSLWAQPEEDRALRFGWKHLIYNEKTCYLRFIRTDWLPTEKPEEWWSTLTPGVGIPMVTSLSIGRSKQMIDGHVYIVVEQEKDRMVYSVAGLRLRSGQIHTIYK